MKARHGLLLGLMVAGLSLLATGCQSTGGRCPFAGSSAVKFDNSYFYDANGKFQEEKAKDAYIAMMKADGYPVFPGLREKIWVSDYGTGQFAKLGLGAVMFENNTRDHYMVMDLYLLPNQMLPEHWHLATDKNPAKIEGWLVRYGSSHIVGEGEANLPKDLVIPACHDGGKVTVYHDTFTTPGQFVELNRVGAHHWQLAGPQGAIITEVATVHDDSGVRHLDAKINANFLKQ